MIFAYWHDTDHSPLRSFISHWQAYFPEFRVIGDYEVEPLINKYFPEFLEKYRAISLPTCRANLARMLMLYEVGGLYVDCHCGIVDPVRVQALLDSATESTFTLFDKDLADGRPADQLWPLYSILVCRAGCPIVLDIAAAAIRNLSEHWRREASEDFSPYNIWEMCGTGLVADVILDRAAQPARPRSYPGWQIRLLPETHAAPIRRYMFYSYRRPGMHWSERQDRERLYRRHSGVAPSQRHAPHALTGGRLQAAPLLD
jgi:mannosyltransferase OCH1-like enzyme